VPSPKDPPLEEFRLFDELGAESVDGIAALFSEDCLFEEARTLERRRGRGVLREATVELIRGLPDLHIEPLEIYETGLTATMILELSGTHLGPFLGHPATGRRLRWRGVVVYRCNEACTEVEREFFAYDTALILSQIEGRSSAD
jgi:hypothetical protein